MILECFIGSIFGSAIGMWISGLIVLWEINKDFEKQNKKAREMIEELTTFKIKFEDVI